MQAILEMCGMELTGRPFDGLDSSDLGSRDNVLNLKQ